MDFYKRPIMKEKLKYTYRLKGLLCTEVTGEGSKSRVNNYLHGRF